jgi:hypothetical protein
MLKLGGVSKPEHLVVKPDGHTSGFVVQVETKNVSHVTSEPTTTELVGVFETSKEFLGEAKVKALKPGKGQKVTVDIGNQFLDLGFMKVLAIANAIHPIPEARRSNNSLEKGHVAVIPEAWKVSEFDTLGKTPGGPTSEAFASTAMRFVFSKYVPADEGFEYLVYGGVNGRISGSFQGVCTVSGQAFTSHSPWSEKSAMLLSQKLNRYKAFVFASADEPWESTVTCGGSSLSDKKEKFLNLITEVQGSDYASMTPGALTVSDSTIYQEVEFYWEFAADIAGEPPPPPPPPPPA